MDLELRITYSFDVTILCDGHNLVKSMFILLSDNPLILSRLPLMHAKIKKICNVGGGLVADKSVVLLSGQDLSMKVFSSSSRPLNFPRFTIVIQSFSTNLPSMFASFKLCVFSGVKKNSSTIQTI